MATIKRSLPRIPVLQQEPKSSIENTPWHPADIKAALEKRGVSLAQLSRRNGYHETAAGRALRISWPEMERIIAEALGISPQSIWPDRYSRDGLPLKYLTPRRQKKLPQSAPKDPR
jgi:Ner family transcriptional regulator